MIIFNNKNKSSLFEKVNIIVLAGALIYFTGWMYCYYIFKYFGILSGLHDIQLYHLLLYSYSILIDKYVFIILLSLSISIYLLGRFLPINIPYYYLFIILYILFFITLNFGAKREANKEIIRITHGIKVKHIKFILKKDNIHKFPSKFYKLNDKGELIYLHSTKDRYYVFSPEKDSRQKSPGIVFDIPISNIFIEIILCK
jgi:hypothetical protein